MLIAFHKPYGMLCQFTPDQEGQLTLAQADFPKEIYPIGRLDLDSEGLLLLSDEPGLNTRLLDPKHGHPRTYHAQVEGEVTDAALEKLRGGGIRIQDHLTLPSRAHRVDPAHPDRDPPIRHRAAIPTSWVELSLTEGKNRQVRRMTAAVGFPTLRLIRVAIGGLTLADLGLPPGHWRALTAAERALVLPTAADPQATGRLPSATRKKRPRRRRHSHE